MTPVDMHIFETLARKSLEEFVSLIENLQRLGAPPGLLIQLTNVGTSRSSGANEKASDLAYEILRWGTKEWNLDSEAVARIFNGKSTVLQEQDIRIDSSRNP